MPDFLGRGGSIPRWQLQLLYQQAARLPYTLFVVDLFICIYLVSLGNMVGMVPWLFASTGAQVVRWQYIRRLRDHSGALSARQELGLLACYFLVGAVRIWPIMQVARHGDDNAQYMITLIHVGLAAGGVGSVVGTVRSYLAWVLPVGSALVVMWLLKQTPAAIGLAGLVALMYATLTAYVRDFGQALQQQETLTENLRIERDRAESAIAARNRFFAAASHDLRQPLGVLRWYGDAVAVHARRLDSGPLQDIAQGIARAVERAEPMVRKYLDIARFEAGAVQAAPEVIELPRLLREVCEAHLPDAQSRGLELLIALPPSAEPLRVVADPSLLTSILDNLVGNALKFTSRGSVTLSAVPLGQGGSRRARIQVRDTGIGIDPADHARVFEDFFQVGNEQRNASAGVGLGLAIAKRQAQLLGTGIELTSALGQGACFAFELPCHEAAEQAAAPASREPAPIARRRTLIIDDEAEVRSSLSATLRALEWEVCTAADTEEALHLYGNGRGFVPELLLMDFRLTGGITGADALKALRHGGLGAPAIFITGDTAPGRLRDLAATGVPVLHKPVALSALLQEVDRLVPGGTAHEERKPVAVGGG